MLYFFNFVQTPAYAQLSDGARSEALRKLTFRALWWFRWAALLTFLFGVMLVGIQGDGENTDLYLDGANGTAILTGMLLGTTMFLNVWGVIWRNQKVIIGSAESVANGGEADPRAATLAKPAARASRANTLMSIPMLWFMVFAAHGRCWFRRRSAARSATGSSCSCCGPSSRRPPSGSSAASTARSTSWSSTRTRTRSSPGSCCSAIIYFVGWELILAA